MRDERYNDNINYYHGHNQPYLPYAHLVSDSASLTRFREWTTNLAYLLHSLPHFQYLVSLMTQLLLDAFVRISWGAQFLRGLHITRSSISLSEVDLTVLTYKTSLSLYFFPLRCRAANEFAHDHIICCLYPETCNT